MDTEIVIFGKPAYFPNEITQDHRLLRGPMGLEAGNWKRHPQVWWLEQLISIETIFRLKDLNPTGLYKSSPEKKIRKKNLWFGTVSNGFRHCLSPTDSPPKKKCNSSNPKTQAIYYSMSSQKLRAFVYFISIFSNESTQLSKSQEPGFYRGHYMTLTQTSCTIIHGKSLKNSIHLHLKR